MTRPALALGVLCVLLVVTMAAATSVGASRLTPAQVWDALRAGPHGGVTDAQHSAVLIVWTLRGTRICLAALAGACLALAGAAFQALLRNPLADPFLIGVSAGASVGAEAVLLRGPASARRDTEAAGAAFVSGLAATALVYGLARRGGRVGVTQLLLGGVVLSSLLGGVSTLLLTLARPDEGARVQFRLLGTFSEATWGQCGMVGAVLVVGLLTLLAVSRQMDILAVGEEGAMQLGVDAERLKTLLTAAGTLLAASTVAACGAIGFVGLAAPHMARRLCGSPRHAGVVPCAAAAGAFLLVLADTAARTVPDLLTHSGAELPVGVVTALAGAPLFLWLLRRGAVR